MHGYFGGEDIWAAVLGGGQGNLGGSFGGDDVWVAVLGGGGHVRLKPFINHAT